MDKISIKTDVPKGVLFDIIRDGIVFPVDDKAMEEQPEDSMLKLEKYDKGKNLFLQTVKLMALAVLKQIPPLAESIQIELIVTPSKDVSE